MHPVLVSFRLYMRLVRDLISGVRARGRDVCAQSGAGGCWPDAARRGAARLLAAGVRLAEACVRRLLLMMALELEPTLVDDPKPMRRPHGRRSLARGPRFQVLPAPCGPMSSAVWDRLAHGRRADGRRAPGPVHVGRLQQRLDLVAMIAADPLARARRLAFHLARRRPGLILAPDRHLRPPAALRRIWGAEVSASFSAMGFGILERSRSRPPPLPPPRRYGPSITIFGM